MSSSLHKGFRFLMGSCLIYSNTVVAGLIIRQMCEMLRHPVPGARKVIIRKRAIATMTQGQNVTFYYSTCILGFMCFLFVHTIR